MLPRFDTGRIVGRWTVRCTRERDLWFLVIRDGIDNLPVGDVTHLVVLLDRQASFIANHIACIIVLVVIAVRRFLDIRIPRLERLANLVLFADVAVDSGPSRFAFASFPFLSWVPICTSSKRATQWCEAVLPAPSVGAFALAVRGAAFAKLGAIEGRKHTVEAWWTFIVVSRSGEGIGWYA